METILFFIVSIICFVICYIFYHACHAKFAWEIDRLKKKIKEEIEKFDNLKNENEAEIDRLKQKAETDEKYYWFRWGEEMKQREKEQKEIKKLRSQKDTTNFAKQQHIQELQKFVDEGWYTLKRTAKEVNLSEKEVIEKLSLGDLEGKQDINGKWYIEPQSIHNYLISTRPEIRPILNIEI